MNQTIKQYIVSYIKILLGAMFYALGFGLFCYPNDITTGGVTGIAMIIFRSSAVTYRLGRFSSFRGANSG